MKSNTITVKIQAPGMNLNTYKIRLSKEEFILYLAQRFPKQVEVNKTLITMNIYPHCLYLRHFDSAQSCHHAVFVKDITYIEVKAELCCLHLTGEQTLSAYLALDEIAQYLPTDHFHYIDHRCIVNTHYIKRITGRVVTMIDGETLEICDELYPQFIKNFHYIG